MLADHLVTNGAVREHFTSPESAYAAYCSAAIKVYGEFARLA